MPFAQWHAPFEGQDVFEQRFPADYICEGLDQTRGWFYSLLAVSTLLFGRASFETVLCLGLILDGEGQKMSKSRGNIVVPWDVIEAHGADALRWYYFTSKQPWDGYRFSLETVGESVRQFMKTLWNTYGFFVLYANANDVDTPPVAGLELTDIDRWALSRLHAATEIAVERLEDYDTTSAGRAVAAFVDDLSNWYVRRSRRRFWDGDPAAFATPARVPRHDRPPACSPGPVHHRRDLRATLTAQSSPCTSPTIRSRDPATRSSSGTWTWHGRRSSLAAPRARRPR